MLRHLTLLAAGALCFLGTAHAQLPSQATLKGAYNVRYVGGAIGNTADTALSFQGTLTFDGNGGFTATGSGVSAGATLKYLTTGKYTVLSSGMVSLDNPFADPNSSTGKATIYGGVSSTGIIVGSSTESLYCDLFIAIPAATSASLATLTGAYTMAAIDFNNGDFTASKNAFFPATADAKGGFGTLAVAGTAQSLGNKATTQTGGGATTYTMTANGAGTLVVAAPTGSVTAAQTILGSGTKNMFVSQDGSFFIAGSPTGYDFVIGLKTNAGGQMNGLYWSAYLNNYQSGGQSDGLTGASGSANELASSGNLEIAHDRTNFEFEYPYDYTYSDVFKFDNTGLVNYTSGDFPSSYAVGPNGDIVIGAGSSFNYLLAIYVKAPTMTAPTGTTVFLNPQGITNAANSAPITTQVAPGEYVTLYGTGLGPSTAVSAPKAPFDTNLGGTQVLINSKPAPVYYVSATQVTALVPNDAPGDGSPLTFQVVTGAGQSNTATVYSGATSPGLFSIPPGGPFPGAILRQDYSVMSQSNPAKAGETVAMYLTGLGPVSPALTSGAAAPSSPLSQLSNQIFIYIDGVQANVVFAGLAPGLVNTYQLNVTIPAGVSKGEVGIDIQTTTGTGQTLALDSWNFEGSIFIQ